MKMVQLPALSSAAALIIFAAIFLVYTSIGYAAENEVPDITMSVLESEEDAKRIISEISLPARVSPPAQEHAARGLDTANDARERGREFGQERAAQARERGKPGKPDNPGKKPNPGNPGNPNP